VGLVNQLTVLIGGTNGYGINDACIILCRLFNHLGYYSYSYNDFPSVIKGQHQYAIVRAASEKISAHTRKPDWALILDQEAMDLHQRDFGVETVIIYDADKVTKIGLPQNTIGLSLSTIVKEGGGATEMRPTCLVAALCKQMGIKWSDIKTVVRKHHPNKAGIETDLMRLVYGQVSQRTSPRRKSTNQSNLTITVPENPGKSALPVMNGCQAISLGLLQTGLRAYTAYPMTPTSPMLEYLAGLEKEAGLQVVLPESEIAVIMTALGYSYMGIKNAIGTSGGGFSLMVEGLGLSGMSELPVVVVMGQRAGPSTGMPTYTAQTDLLFVLHAGHGEFSRFVVAPGDAEEAYFWSGIAMNKAWKFRMPAIVIIDKTLGLGIYSFDITRTPVLKEEKTDDTLNSTMLKAGRVVKANSYLHDEKGYARENPELAKAFTDKLAQKLDLLAEDLDEYEQVKVYGKGSTVLLCWGSTKGVCIEIAAKYGLKVIQVLVVSPFPKKAIAKALQKVQRVISVEGNAHGQLAILMQQNGFSVNNQILKYDGRPFTLEDLEDEVKKVMK
jgi:2-oxoglutarate/2-oxoacid ferredoxin oxidoreductase subunit alpha